MFIREQSHGTDFVHGQDMRYQMRSWQSYPKNEDASASSNAAVGY